MSCYYQQNYIDDVTNQTVMTMILGCGDVPMDPGDLFWERYAIVSQRYTDNKKPPYNLITIKVHYKKAKVKNGKTLGEFSCGAVVKP